MKKRNESIDIIKGIGILLMILGHCLLPVYLKKIIFVFHMPLFFLISGYLYKDRTISEIADVTLKKILKAYLFTGVIIWIFMISRGQGEWGLSLLFGNGSRPLFNCDILREYKVGPLWYLLAYCWAVVGFHFLLKIKDEKKRLIILLFAFEISIIFAHFIGLLPLDIIPAIPAVIFMTVGYCYKQGKYIRHRQFTRLFHFTGLGTVFLCVYKGGISMASHSYTLNVLQLLAAVYMSYCLFLGVKSITVKPCNSSLLNVARGGGNFSWQIFTTNYVFPFNRLEYWFK